MALVNILASIPKTKKYELYAQLFVDFEKKLLLPFLPAFAPIWARTPSVQAKRVELNELPGPNPAFNECGGIFSFQSFANILIALRLEPGAHEDPAGLIRVRRQFVPRVRAN